MISSSRNNTGLVIETSSHTPHLYGIELVPCYAPRWHGHRLRKVVCVSDSSAFAWSIEYVHASWSSSR
ncbi:hypothetical protein TNCV_271251 [Trichonephila clavipes]|nr:hypothetical protein TNCV_271251 [Trichonephila clavipes]